MQVNLRLEYGRVIPTLTLTSEERELFTQCNIPTHVSIQQMTIGLGDQGNPRYPRSPQICESYQAARVLNQLDLENCVNYILADFNSLLRERNRPPLTAIGDVQVQDQANELVNRVRMVFPLAESDPDVDNLHIVVNGQMWRLNPVLTGNRSVYNEIRDEWQTRFGAYRTSIDGQVSAIRQEYEQQIQVMQQQISRSLTLPITLDHGAMLANDIIFFARSPHLPQGRDVLAYWFQLPFKVRMNKLARGTTIRRLKPEFRINADGYLTMGYRTDGRLPNEHRFVTLDRLMTRGVNHCHRMGSNTFCSGSMAQQVIDFSRDIIPQVVRHRDSFQSLLEVANSNSFGSPRGGIGAELIAEFSGRNWNRVALTVEEVRAEDALIASGDAPPLEQTRSGIDTLWSLSPSDIRRAEEGTLATRRRRT